MKNKVTILGAGIAGVAAAHHLKIKNIILIIFEASSRTGGLLDNFSIDGFRFDNAVHLSFATESEVREIFDKTKYIKHASTSWCWDNSLWLKHPVQNNLAPLPVDEKVDLINSLYLQPQREIINYRDWLENQYGEAIASRWHIPYTEKYWTIPPEDMSVGWIGSRVRKADIKEVLRGAFTCDTPNYYYASEMRYPRNGGYKSFIEPIIDQLDIKLLHQVEKIDVTNKKIYFSNNEAVEYNKIISTIPLPKLIQFIAGVPQQVLRASDSLFATSIDLISIGFRRPNIQPYLWFYIYDREIYAARAYSPSVKSQDNAPKGCSSLQFEIYSSKRKPRTQSIDEIKQNTMEALFRMRIISTENDVLFIHHKHVPWANVIFDLGMEQRRDIVHRWLKENGIIVAGRFGDWDYLWSNQAYMSGVRAAKKINNLE